MQRNDFMQHLHHSGNRALITLRRPRNDLLANFFVSNKVTDKCIISTLDNAQVFPLHLYPASDELDTSAGRRPNIAPEFLKALAEKLKVPQEGPHGLPRGVTPEDIFHYAYAVFHSPTYRTRYAEFLKIDFPRLPLTSNRDLFFNLAALGGELVALHIMESPKLNDLITEFPEKGTDIVEKVTYAANANVGQPSRLPEEGTQPSRLPQQEGKQDACPTFGRVYINPTQYFGGVPSQVWNFHIGGYQVCEKWLKDRKGRTLTYDDIQHYQKIIVALSETIRLMAEIDKLIESRGGWLGAFQTERTTIGDAGARNLGLD